MQPIQKLFTNISDTYEIINHILTFGMDIRWRKKLVKSALSEKSRLLLDVCTGTGETANYLRGNAGPDTMVFALDFSAQMLKLALAKPAGDTIHFTLADVKSLPFQDKSFDIITLTFATRNININREILIETFREFYRVLKPGGKFLNLETSQPESRIVRKLSHSHLN